jgi:biofilm protein TabA
MITDTLANSNIYKLLHKNLATAIEFLQTADLKSLPLGKTVIDADNVIVNINEYNTKSPNDCKWEAHKTFADIQMLISGEELIGFAPIETLTITETYDQTKDILFLEGKGEYLNMQPGKFAIFFPHDAHQPCVVNKTTLAVRKMVVKVKL